MKKTKTIALAFLTIGALSSCKKETYQECIERTHDMIGCGTDNGQNSGYGYTAHPHGATIIYGGGGQTYSNSYGSYGNTGSFSGSRSAGTSEEASVSRGGFGESAHGGGGE